jgi:hypothetical protein
MDCNIFQKKTLQYKRKGERSKGRERTRCSSFEVGTDINSSALN